MKNVKEIKGRIYLITNLVNGKQYIGQTIRTIGERWAGHKCDSLTMRKNTAMANAIRKYGADNFKIDLLEDNIPYNKLDEIEINYIRDYNTVSPNGYNISYGGQSIRTDEERLQMSLRVSGENNPMYGAVGELNPFYGREHTEENKKILSEKGRKRWDNLSEEEKEKHIQRLDRMRDDMIETLGGGFAGKNHSEDSKKAISLKLKGKTFSEEHNRKISENSPFKRRVVMLDMDGMYIAEFESMTKACKWLIDNEDIENPKAGSISDVCLGGSNSVYKHIWVYAEEYDITKEYSSRCKGTKVICLNTSKVFNSMVLASEYYNIAYRGIDACCRNRQNTCGKDDNGNELFWMHYDKYLKLSQSEQHDLIKSVKNHNDNLRKDLRVVCLTTDKIFNSPKEACKYYNIKSTSDLYKCFRGDRKSAGKLKDGTKLKWIWHYEYVKNIGKDAV